VDVNQLSYVDVLIWTAQSSAVPATPPAKSPATPTTTTAVGP